MFPEHSNPVPSRPHCAKQSGAALVVAIFIIIVMALLAAVIARVISTGAAASVDEVYGTRAFQAANSGAQVFMLELIDALEDDAVDYTATCPVENSRLDFDAPGLQNCYSQRRCAVNNYSDFGLIRFQITSIGRCSAANQQYSRIITVEMVDGHF